MTHGRECGFADTTAAGELPARNTTASPRGRHGKTARGARESVGRKGLDGPGAGREKAAGGAGVDRAPGGQTRAASGRAATLHDST